MAFAAFKTVISFGRPRRLRSRFEYTDGVFPIAAAASCDCSFALSLAALRF